MTTHEMHIQGKVIESFERNNNIIIFTLEGKQKLKTFFSVVYWPCKSSHAKRVGKTFKCSTFRSRKMQHDVWAYHLPTWCGTYNFQPPMYVHIMYYVEIETSPG